MAPPPPPPLPPIQSKIQPGRYQYSDLHDDGVRDWFSVACIPLFMSFIVAIVAVVTISVWTKASHNLETSDSRSSRNMASSSSMLLLLLLLWLLKIAGSLGLYRLSRRRGSMQKLLFPSGDIEEGRWLPKTGTGPYS